MNNRTNVQAITDNVNTMTTANDENLAADRAKVAVNRLVLRRQGRMMSIAIGVGLFLGTPAATAVFFLEKYDYLIFRNGGRHQIVVDGRWIDLGISPENSDRIRSFATEIENISCVVIVTTVLPATLMVGAVVQGVYVAVRMQTYLSSEFPRRSILLAHAKAFGLGTVTSDALAVAGAAVRGSIAGDFSGNIKVTGMRADRVVGTYEASLWLLALAAMAAIAGVYVVAYRIFMVSVRSPEYVVGIALFAVSAAGGVLNWIFRAVGSDDSFIYVTPLRHIGASGFLLYSVLSDLASIVFYAVVVWLYMQRIQTRR